MGISSSRGPWALVPRRITDVGVVRGAEGPRSRYTVVRLKANSEGISCGAWRTLGAGMAARWAYRSSLLAVLAGSVGPSRFVEVSNNDIGFFSSSCGLSVCICLR